MRELEAEHQAKFSPMQMNTELKVGPEQTDSAPTDEIRLTAMQAAMQVHAADTPAVSAEQLIATDEQSIERYRQAMVSGTTKERGYTGEHVRRRRLALAALVPGTPWHLCGLPMYAEQALDLAHSPDRSEYRGLAHTPIPAGMGRVAGGIAPSTGRRIE